MHLFVLYVVCACFIIKLVDLKEMDTKFDRNRALDGYQCPGTKVLFVFTSLGKVHCAKECAQTVTCIGIFFVPESRKCIGCNSQFDTNVKDILAGSVFYKRKSNFSYLGCFHDTTSRILNEKSTSTATMTTEECIYFCMQGNYTHALTEYYSSCFCGNGFVGPTVQGLESECNSYCVGNPSQMCGGYWRGSVYLL